MRTSDKVDDGIKTVERTPGKSGFVTPFHKKMQFKDSLDIKCSELSPNSSISGKGNQPNLHSAELRLHHKPLLAQNEFQKRRNLPHESNDISNKTNEANAKSGLSDRWYTSIPASGGNIKNGVSTVEDEGN